MIAQIRPNTNYLKTYPYKIDTDEKKADYLIELLNNSAVEPEIYIELAGVLKLKRKKMVMLLSQILE